MSFLDLAISGSQPNDLGRPPNQSQLLTGPALYISQYRISASLKNFGYAQLITGNKRQMVSEMTTLPGIGRGAVGSPGILGRWIGITWVFLRGKGSRVGFRKDPASELFLAVGFRNVWQGTGTSNLDHRGTSLQKKSDPAYVE